MILTILQGNIRSGQTDLQAASTEGRMNCSMLESNRWSDALL